MKNIGKKLFQMIKNGKKHKEAKKFKGHEVAEIISNHEKWYET